VAVALAGPYASLHLAPDRQPHQHPTALFFTGQVPFLPPNQQCQSTEGKEAEWIKKVSENWYTCYTSSGIASIPELKNKMITSLY